MEIYDKIGKGIVPGEGCSQIAQMTQIKNKHLRNPRNLRETFLQWRIVVGKYYCYQ